MLNKIAVAAVVVAGTLFSGFAATPAHAEIVSETSTYKFDAIYNGQNLHNYVNDVAKGSMQQNDWLRSNVINQTQQNTSSNYHKDEAGSSKVVQSSLHLQAIPGLAGAGTVQVGGSQSKFNTVTNINGSQHADSYSNSLVDKNSGMSKSFDNSLTRQQDFTSNNFASGNFKAGQNSAKFWYGF